MMKRFVARDMNGELFMYDEEPVRGEIMFTPKDYPKSERKKPTFYTLDQDLFPEVTWENSPKKVEIKIVD